MVNDIELAKLTNTLHVPIVVQDVMDGHQDLSDDVRYGMHEVLSDYQPDSALLCIALSARKIAASFAAEHTNMAILKMECDRMIHDYAELWIEHAKNKPIDDNLVFDTLAHIPEDLECLAELLEIASMFLGYKDETSAALCEILAIQARAQVIVADTFIDLIEQDEVESVMPEQPIAYNDNVIQFPLRAV